MVLLGVDIGGTNIRVGLVNQDRLVKVESAPIKKNGSEDEIIADINEMISKFSSGKIDGIGVGVPSVVDVEKGIVFDVQNIPSWKEVELKRKLEDVHNIPVYINNDANCFAAGEKYFGKAEKYKDVVGLIIGTGLGAGIIVNNRLYAGTNCGAGEFGMLPYKDGIYEHYCSGQYFADRFGLSGKELSEKADEGDEKALMIFKEYGANLGEAIKMVMYAVDPEIIVLGGSVSKSFRFFKDEMWISMKTFAYSRSADKIKIEVSDTENIAILGAAALYYDAQVK